MFKKIIPFLVIGSAMVIGSLQAAPGTGTHSLPAKITPVEKVEQTQETKEVKETKKVQADKKEQPSTSEEKVQSGDKK